MWTSPIYYEPSGLIGAPGIPVSAVSQARALAENGIQAGRGAPSPLSNGDAATAASDNLRVSTSSTLLDPPSPTAGVRRSLGAGNTSRVLADLQAGVANTRAALENTKAQLRGAQRTVASLTRQNEELKDGRERLRVENEGLNTVVSRKERLLQEVLERARRAESEASNLKAQLKNETTTSKKTMREMEIALAEATALSQKSEREYLTLKDAVKSLQDGWRADVERLQEEIKGKEAAWKKEIEQVNLKYNTYVKLQKSSQYVLSHAALRFADGMLQVRKSKDRGTQDRIETTRHKIRGNHAQRAAIVAGCGREVECRIRARCCNRAVCYITTNV